MIQSIILLALCLYISQSFSTTLAVSDRDILSDPISNVYTSGVNGEAITTNINNNVKNDIVTKPPFKNKSIIE